MGFDFDDCYRWVYSPLSANIYFPAIPLLSQDFGVSVSLMNLTITVYLIFQGISPMLWAPLADTKGRRPVYLICLSILTVTCVALALVPTSKWWLLIIFRCLQASGSASTVALGSGVVADIATPSERGGFLGFTTLGVLMGPCIGPVIGGLLAGGLGWRWIFWFLCILSGVCLILIFLWVTPVAWRRARPEPSPKQLPPRNAPSHRRKRLSTCTKLVESPLDPRYRTTPSTKKDLNANTGNATASKTTPPLKPVPPLPRTGRHVYAALYRTNVLPLRQHPIHHVPFIPTSLSSAEPDGSRAVLPTDGHGVVLEQRVYGQAVGLGVQAVQEGVGGEAEGSVGGEEERGGTCRMREAGARDSVDTPTEQRGRVDVPRGEGSSEVVVSVHGVDRCGMHWVWVVLGQEDAYSRSPGHPVRRWMGRRRPDELVPNALDRRFTYTRIVDHRYQQLRSMSPRCRSHIRGKPHHRRHRSRLDLHYFLVDRSRRDTHIHACCDSVRPPLEEKKMGKEESKLKLELSDSNRGIGGGKFGHPAVS